LDEVIPVFFLFASIEVAILPRTSEKETPAKEIFKQMGKK